MTIQHSLILRNKNQSFTYIMSSYVFICISNLHLTCNRYLLFSVNKECKAHFGKMYQLTSVNEKNSPRPPTALKPLSIFESILALHVIQSCGKSGLVTFVPSVAVLLDLQMSTCSMHHFISSVLFVMN